MNRRSTVDTQPINDMSRIEAPEKPARNQSPTNEDTYYEEEDDFEEQEIGFDSSIGSLDINDEFSSAGYNTARQGRSDVQQLPDTSYSSVPIDREVTLDLEDISPLGAKDRSIKK